MSLQGPARWLPLSWARLSWTCPRICLGVEESLCELGRSICRMWHSHRDFFQSLSLCALSDYHVPDIELIGPFSTGVLHLNPGTQKVILLTLARTGHDEYHPWCMGAKLIQNRQWVPQDTRDWFSLGPGLLFAVSPASRIVPDT